MNLQCLQRWFRYFLGGREVSYHAGINYYNEGKFQEALEVFSSILAQQLPSVSLHNQFAALLFGLSHCNLGVLLIYSGDYSHAIEHLKCSIQFIPKNFAPHYYLGIAYNNLRQMKEAMAAFNEVMCLNPDFLPVKAKVAILFYNESRYQEAQTELEKVIGKNPNWADLRFHLGLVKASQGNCQDGLKELEAALAINPDYIKARITKPLLMAKLGQCREGDRGTGESSGRATRFRRCPLLPRPDLWGQQPLARGPNLPGKGRRAEPPVHGRPFQPGRGPTRPGLI